MKMLLSAKRVAAAVLTLCLLSCAPVAMADTVSTSISVVLTMAGDVPPTTSNFTFVLLPLDKSNPMPVHDTLTIAGAGSGVFGPIDYTEPNDYVYKLYQTPGGLNGYTYDATVYTVTVQVTSDAAGKLTATAYLDNGAKVKPTKVTFVNRYKITTGIPKTGYGDTADSLWGRICGWFH